MIPLERFTNLRARGESLRAREDLERCDLIVELDDLRDSQPSIFVAHLGELAEGRAVVHALRQSNSEDVADDRQNSRVKLNRLRNVGHIRNERGNQIYELRRCSTERRISRISLWQT